MPNNYDAEAWAASARLRKKDRGPADEDRAKLAQRKLDNIKLQIAAEEANLKRAVEDRRQYQDATLRQVDEKHAACDAECAKKRAEAEANLEASRNVLSERTALANQIMRERGKISYQNMQKELRKTAELFDKEFSE